MSTAYSHTQKGHWHWLLYAVAGVFLVVGVVFPSKPVLNTVLPGSGLIVLVVAASFHYLKVEDQGSQLGVHFGPVPLFRRSIRYDDIQEVEKGRSSLIEGWGIHWMPGRGWLWNISGFDCVVVRLKHGTLRIGTDVPDGLVEFLRSRIVRV